MTDETEKLPPTLAEYEEKLAMPRNKQQAEEVQRRIERWMEATASWQDESQFEDPVHVTCDHEGAVSGSVFHTTEHMTDNPRWGNGTPAWRYIERPTAKVFGMRECRICERSRVLGDKVDDGIVVMRIEEDSVRLRVHGKPVTAKVGHYIEPGQGVVMLTEQVREKLGITTEEDD